MESCLFVIRFCTNITIWRSRPLEKDPAMFLIRQKDVRLKKQDNLHF